MYPEEMCPIACQKRGCGGRDTNPLREVASVEISGQCRGLYESELAGAYAYDEKL